MPIPSDRRRPAALAAVVAGTVLGLAYDASRQPSADRAATLGLAVVGLVAGALLGRVVPRSRRRRTAVEHVNDGAFAVVVLVVWLLAVAQLGRWSGVVTGVIAGFALQAASRGRSAGAAPG